MSNRITRRFGRLGIGAAVLVAMAVVGITMQAESAKRKDPALDAYANCIFDTVMRLDDGRSDAKTVALGVASECAWKRELAIAEMQSVIGSDDPGARQGLADGVRDSEIERIVATVLDLRRRRGRHPAREAR
jgi:hypothetical protein